MEKNGNYAGKDHCSRGEGLCTGDKSLRAIWGVDKGAYASWESVTMRGKHQELRGNTVISLISFTLKRRLLGSPLALSFLHQTRHIYISTESYLQGESNGIGYVARGKDSMANMVYYCMVSPSVKMDISGA